MRLARWTGSLMLAGLAAVAVVGSGCTKNEPAKPPPGGPAKNKDHKDHGHKDEKESDGKKTLAKGDTKHEGWWCQEHGIPEEICSLCSTDAAAKFKKAGDWCKIHDRAQSQCFKCDPGFYKKFEAMYVAKYNKKPEPPPKEEFEK